MIGMKPFLLSVLALLWLNISVAQAQSTAGQDFPLYSCIKPNVEFWKSIYSRYSTAQGVIHDNEDLSIVYEVVDLENDGYGHSSKRNQERIEKRKKKYADVLLRLAAGAGESSGEEKRVRQLFGAKASAGVFRAAAENVRFQLGQSDRFQEGVSRSGAYLDEIRKILRSHNLPEDLAYLPHVESSFNPKAYSRLGAAGMWQFTQATAKQYMNVDYVVDERRDPILSTHAAAKFLKRSYETLGSWPLALTAYNHGVSGVYTAKQRQGSYEAIFRDYRGERFGFASRNFYSEFLAAREVAKNYRSYFPNTKLAAPDSCQVVELPGHIALADICRAFDLEVETIKLLNPALREPVFEDHKYIPKGYKMRFPGGANKDFKKLLAALPDKYLHDRQRPSKFHRVQRGETPGAVAKQHGVRLDALLAANNLSSRSTIQIGQNLVIPASSSGGSLAQAKKKAEEERPVQLAAATKTVSKKKSPAAEPQAKPEPGAGSGAPAPATPAATLVAAVATSAAAKDAVFPADQGSKAVSGAGEAAPAVAMVEEVVNPASASPAAAVAVSEAALNSAVVLGDLEVKRVKAGKNGTFGFIKVEAEETLSHYAEWLGITTEELRRLNSFRAARGLRLDEEIKVPLQKATKGEFEERRFEYHKQMEEDFYSSYSIAEVQEYAVTNGDNVWKLCQEKEVPLWLIRKYNAELNLNDLQPAQKVLIPVPAKVS